ncbi:MULTISPECIES: TetR/AcrR family transcriptional regulator [unclassified Achromobacter]|uniref:TetR/AcrR family transcriptional regulator n=1 Tax=unclassified Achromobacter TaxID=2626865 RepID=UPI000B51DE0F|nr:MULTISPECIES: TetR/AcrR family transcriptional regulator [unclassified Achromobacter]OWT76924.1 TetR family transcriptional regulator [Achromobacter sp. HZ28]OWT77804.1 TetR family transcriptional regulator [Achromobacter sp. HZ34]
MARPREFDESAALDAAMQCFWAKGYEATSVRDLADAMKISGASLYNTFGDKRALYERAFHRYAETGFYPRALRFESELPPLDAIAGFFEEIIGMSLRDEQRRGCMIVNSALELAPHDPAFQQSLKVVLQDMEAFFFRCVSAGQRDGTIASQSAARDLARMLLGILMGVRVLARARPEPELLNGLVRPALAQLRK